MSAKNQIAARGPWPGPRPFRSDEWLYGRDRELGALRRAVRQFRVVALHAPSGVGKSSLLNAGLVPDLQADGHAVLLCTVGFVAGGDTDEFFAAMLRDGLTAAQLLTGPEGRSDSYARDPVAFADWVLDTLYAADDEGNRPPEPVLIFDQFEEVIRRDPELAERFLGKVIEVARRRPAIKQIVSLRSEYTFRLEPLRLGLGSAGWYSPFELSELRDDALVEVIAEPARRWSEETGQPPVLDDSAVEAVLADWHAARRLQRGVKERKSSDPIARSTVRLVDELGGATVGLLHLQALLDALFHAHQEGGASEPIDADFVQAFRDRFSPAGTDEIASATVLHSALRTYIERALLYRDSRRPWILAGLCDEVATIAADLAPTVIAEVADSLSSGGYKTPLEVSEFVRRAVKEVLGPLSSGDVSSGDGVLRFTEAASEAIHRLLEGSDPGRNPLLAVPLDTGNLGNRGYRTVAGPARRLGLSDQQVQATVVRATALGMGRLLDESILRKSSSVGRQEIYELVHDGFGPALKAWAADHLTGIARFVQSPTDIVGESVSWDAAALRNDLSHLRWIGCWVGTEGDRALRAERVMFDRCEFRGTVFEGIEFIGCTFRDCNLNGVIFRDCFLDDVTFEWSLRSSPRDALAADERSYDMLTFDGINARKDARDVAVRFRGLRQMRNTSVEDAHGRWCIEGHCSLSQVSLGSGTADIDVDTSTLRQWWVSPEWKGNITLRNSAIRQSLVSPGGYCIIKDAGGMESSLNSFDAAVISRIADAPPGSDP